MVEANLIKDWNFEKNKKSWILSLKYFENDNSLLAGTCSGQIIKVDAELRLKQPLITYNDGLSRINSIEVIDENSFLSSSKEGVKIWDFRNNCEKCVCKIETKKRQILCLSLKGNYLAGGCEAENDEGSVYLWDIRKNAECVNNVFDAHNDDVTSIEFSPAANGTLISGSTDRYVNVYNIFEKDEDEYLKQVINFESVSKCNFFNENKISVLSHIETLGFYDLNNDVYEKKKYLGDLREYFSDCTYVVNIDKSYLSYGSTGIKNLQVINFGFNNDNLVIFNQFSLPNGHGSEIVRDLIVVSSKIIFSCGEDRSIKSWLIPSDFTDAKSINNNVKKSLNSDQKQLKTIKKKKYQPKKIRQI